MALIVLSVMFAAFLGFAVHRCGVCGVKAVAEVLSTGRAFMFVSFGKIFLWVVAATFILAGLGVTDSNLFMGYSVSARALAGGVLFGMGATINSGCAFSTLTYLGSGDLRYLATLVGFAVGVGLYLLFASSLPTTDVVLHWSPLAGPRGWLLPLALLVWSWAAWELCRLLKKRSPSETWKERPFARHYRLSAGAALTGVANAILFALHGSWAYTGVIADTVEDIVASGQGSNLMTALLAVFMMAGIIISAFQSGRFQVKTSKPTLWIMHLSGGTIMGIGAALVPGGNFVLILHDIPVLSPHALPTFAALVVGIASTLLVMQLASGRVLRIDCSGDMCVD